MWFLIAGAVLIVANAAPALAVPALVVAVLTAIVVGSRQGESRYANQPVVRRMPTRWERENRRHWTPGIGIGLGLGQGGLHPFTYITARRWRR